MLTDLSFVASGRPWPPEDPDERARHDEHAMNRRLYNGDHEAIFPKLSTYLKDKIDDDKKVAIIIGLAKTATRTYLDYLIGEAPEIKAPILYDIPDYPVLTDTSRDGIGLFEITQDGIVAQNPERCYIVVMPGNINQVLAYVFFEKFEQGADSKKQTYVKFTIHAKGYIQHLIFELKDGKLTSGPLPLTNFEQFKELRVDAEGKQYPFGVNPDGSPKQTEILVVRMDNISTTERYYGQSDYTPEVHSKLEAMDLAFCRRAEVLAKFTRPKPMAGLSAFTFDHSKQKYTWKTEEAIVVEAGEPPAQYLTWQAQLADVKVEIDDLYKQLLDDLSLVEDKDLNTAQSGTAIRFKLTKTLAKVRWLASSYKKAVAKALSLKSKLDVALGVAGAIAYEPTEVQIILRDGIPDDPLETAQILQLYDAMGAVSLEAKLEARGLKEGSEAFTKELERIRSAQPAAPQSPEEPPRIQLPAVEEA